MDYISTRDPQRTPATFTDILLGGLAPDGGLYLPADYPQVSDDTLTTWRETLATKGYAALAAEVIKLFVSDIPAEDVEAICAHAYTTPTFSTPDIVPVTELDDNLFIGHLSEGPTAAFKDMAMQLLGEFFEYELTRRGETLNILGATSGDTGSAAEYAMRGRPGISVFMLTPAGRMTPFQQAQMFGLDDPNIHNVALDGVFDDCQDIVKAVSNDAEFKQRYRIGAVNSINWARLMAQIVYYISCWIRITDNNAQKVSFSVPTGNFGDICAGHIVRQMGVPIDRLIVATNENNVLDEFFRTGAYRVRSSADTLETSSPSMDISRASNFERFIYDLLGRDATRTAELFSQREGFTLADDPAFPAAAQRYAKACDLGYAKSCHNAGVVYFTGGFGLAADPAKATSFFERGCDGGLVDSCYNAGVAYDKGLGAPQDRDQAEKLYTKSCELGYGDACNNLGYLYVSKGDLRGFSKGLGWVKKGCDAGNKKSCQLYEFMKNEILKK